MTKNQTPLAGAGIDSQKNVWTFDDLKNYRAFAVSVTLLGSWVVETFGNVDKAFARMLMLTTTSAIATCWFWARRDDAPLIQGSPTKRVFRHGIFIRIVWLLLVGTLIVVTVYFGFLNAEPPEFLASKHFYDPQDFRMGMPQLRHRLVENPGKAEEACIPMMGEGATYTFHIAKQPMLKYLTVLSVSMRVTSIDPLPDKYTVIADTLTSSPMLQMNVTLGREKGLYPAALLQHEQMISVSTRDDQPLVFSVELNALGYGI